LKNLSVGPENQGFIRPQMGLENDFFDFAAGKHLVGRIRHGLNQLF